MVSKLVGTGACLLGIWGLAAAQSTPEPTHSFDLKNSDLPSAFATISKLYGVKVIGQEGLKGSVTAKAGNATIETALTIIAAPNGLVWRKFAVAVQPSDQVSAKTLADLMQAMDAIQFAGLAMQGPKESEGVRFERTAPSEELVGSTAPDGSKYTAFYYVYDPKPKPKEPKVVREKPAGRTAGAPERANLTTGQVMQWFGSLDPGTKVRLIDDLIRAVEQEQGGPDFGPDEPPEGPEGQPTP